MNNAVYESEILILIMIREMHNVNFKISLHKVPLRYITRHKMLTLGQSTPFSIKNVIDIEKRMSFDKLHLPFIKLAFKNAYPNLSCHAIYPFYMFYEAN